MGLETGVVCRDCESFVHLSKLYFPESWTDALIEEQYEPSGGQIRTMIAFMSKHQTHNIALINEYSGEEWTEAIREYDRMGGR